MNAPLAGLTVGRHSAHPAVGTAAWLLSGLGATLTSGAGEDVAIDVEAAGTSTGPRGLVRLEGEGWARDPPGVPAGTMTYATGLALAIGALAAWRGRSLVTVPQIDVAIQLYLPAVMAASYGAPTWPVPPAPTKAPGAGWLSCELGAPGDGDRFATLLTTLAPNASAAAVADVAQEWRLAVCEYRDRPGSDAAPFPVRAAPSEHRGASRPPTTPLSDAACPLAGVGVCDLTAMWAGPLATWLLERLGATVHKVEPDGRVDGMRGVHGGGVHPAGRQRRPGEDSALFNALNSGKRRAPLDLRGHTDRERFRSLVQDCDVVIESFSPRVMPNLGLTRPALTTDDPHRLTVSMPAFPVGPLRPCVAYGTGVHAVSGLGDVGEGTYAAPAVTYPDPLAGLTATMAVLAGLVGRDLGWYPTHLEVPLLSSIGPLTGPAGDDPARVAARDPELGGRLLAAGEAAGAFARGPGCDLGHPVGPFRVDGWVPPLGPVPGLGEAT